MGRLTHLSLFTGIGGIDLASHWAGFETIGQVEKDDYATKVLEKNFPNIPRWRDIKDVTGAEIRKTIGDEQITLISGGFPCQPFSVAGKRRGKEDDRWLWDEMFRVIRELKPTWVLGENVAGFVNMALEDACIDLENEGYYVQSFIIPACAVGAWHERKRVFIVAHSKHNGTHKAENARKNNGAEQKEQIGKKLLLNEFEGVSSLRTTTNIVGGTSTSIFQDSRCELLEGSLEHGTILYEVRKRDANIAERPSQMVSNTTIKRLEGEQWEKSERDREGFTNGSRWKSEPRLGVLADGFPTRLGECWRVEPDIPRMSTGVKNRKDKLKCLGNAVVPQQVYPILKYISMIEGGLMHGEIRNMG